MISIKLQKLILLIVANNKLIQNQEIGSNIALFPIFLNNNNYDKKSNFTHTTASPVL